MADATGGVGPGPGTEGLLEVGLVARPHGLRGDVIVSLTTNRAERVAVGSELRSATGDRYRVVRSSPHAGRFIVQFEGVDGIDAASALRGTVLYAPPLEDPDAMWVHDLVGAEVVDTGGATHGRVESVQANPASDLLVLTDGMLVPVRFVVGHEPGVRVTVDAPDGLFDLA